MSEPEPAPRSAMKPVAVVWAFAVVLGAAIGVFVPAAERTAWLLLGLGLCLLVSFVVQLWGGPARGFIARVAASMVGALVVLSVLSLGFALASIVPVA